MFENLSEKSVADVQEEQVQHWSDIDLLHLCVKEREGDPSFVFYEGPPTANGKPGIHHVMARTLKDSINRYKTMQGFRVKRKAGWDTHGLPVEIEVEKQLGMSGKNDIESYGIKEFNEKCRESVFKYTSLWREMSEKMAYLADMDDPLQIGAAIPGKVVKILVKKGDVVEENQPLIVIEAMKMETNIVAKVAGKISSIEVKEGDMVTDKQLLMTMEAVEVEAEA